MPVCNFVQRFIIGLFALVSLAVFLKSASAETQYEGFVSYSDDLISESWYISSYKNKAAWIDTIWSRDAVHYDPVDGALVLSFYPAENGTGKHHESGEVQRPGRTSYGRYEVVMTAARGEGVISSFFTYTGPHFETPHDEIDFEFLGGDTTKVLLGTFVNGEKFSGHSVNLGFDAAEGPHLYAFEWLPDNLTWYADGRQLLRVTSDETSIPSHPQKVFINVWAGGEAQRDWSGRAPKDIRTAARYYCLSYRPPKADTVQCSDWWTQ